MMASERLRLVFDRQRAAFERDPLPSHDARIARLKALHGAVLAKREEIAAAANADYGGRSWHETMFLDVFAMLSIIRYTMGNLRRWMKPRRRSVDLFLQPARAEVVYQPKGVVGIIGPWNYPVYLSVGPLCAALAAGNRAIVKPSELVPATSEVIARMLAEAFDDDLVATVTGGHDVAQALSALPLDHLFFTGSSTAARSVMRSASENLTPVTLELGGKSPLIVHRDYPVAKAVKRIVVGKFFNAGQTCVAPDYVLVHADRQEELVGELQREITRSYPTLRDNPDYTAIINEAHRSRLFEMVDDARAKGATIVEVNPAAENFRDGTAKIAPTLIVGADERMRVMQEEVFGPLLPVMAYGDLDDAIGFVNRRPRPLSLYYFDNDGSRSRQILRRTTSGGAGINETAIHVLDADLPFGGIGESGMGAYHGEVGFETFSHRKSVFARGRVNSANLLAPPYGRLYDRLLRFLIGS